MVCSSLGQDLPIHEGFGNVLEHSAPLKRLAGLHDADVLLPAEIVGLLMKAARAGAPDLPDQVPAAIAGRHAAVAPLPYDRRLTPHRL